MCGNNSEGFGCGEYGNCVQCCLSGYPLGYGAVGVVAVIVEDFCGVEAAFSVVDRLSG